MTNDAQVNPMGRNPAEIQLANMNGEHRLFIRTDSASPVNNNQYAETGIPLPSSSPYPVSDTYLSANKSSVCFSFSGGGIRSASFSCGVLQQYVEDNACVPEVISSVSGGGYVASSFVHWSRIHALAGIDVTKWSQSFFRNFRRSCGYFVSDWGLAEPITKDTIIRQQIAAENRSKPPRGHIAQFVKGLWDTLTLIFTLLFYLLLGALVILPPAFPYAVILDVFVGSQIRGNPSTIQFWSVLTFFVAFTIGVLLLYVACPFTCWHRLCCDGCWPNGWKWMSRTTDAIKVLGVVCGFTTVIIGLTRAITALDAGSWTNNLLFGSSVIVIGVNFFFGILSLQMRNWLGFILIAWYYSEVASWYVFRNGVYSYDSDNNATLATPDAPIRLLSYVLHYNDWSYFANLSPPYIPQQQHEHFGYGNPAMYIFISVAALGVITVAIKDTALHRFYRHRLRKAFYYPLDGSTCSCGGDKCSLMKPDGLKAKVQAAPNKWGGVGTTRSLLQCGGNAWRHLVHHKLERLQSWFIFNQSIVPYANYALAVPWICCTTVNHWLRDNKADSCSYDPYFLYTDGIKHEYLTEVLDKYNTEDIAPPIPLEKRLQLPISLQPTRVDEIPVPLRPDAEGKDLYRVHRWVGEPISLSTGMALSASAVSYGMGKYQVVIDRMQAGIVQGLLGVGLNRYVRHAPARPNFSEIAALALYLLVVFCLFTLAYFAIYDDEQHPEYIQYSSYVLFSVFCAQVLTIAYFPQAVDRWPNLRAIRSMLGFNRVQYRPPTYLDLSDGGHTENLGVLPLIALRKKFIIIADGGADPLVACEDLFNVMDEARKRWSIEFSIFQMSSLNQNIRESQLDHRSYRGTQQHDIHSAHFDVQTYFNQWKKLKLEGDLNQIDSLTFPIIIHYPDGEKGLIVYCKPRTYDGINDDQHMPRHLYGMCCNCCHNVLCCGCAEILGKFPHHSTANQFFTQTMHVYYRRQGQLAMKAAAEHWKTYQKNRRDSMTALNAAILRSAASTTNTSPISSSSDEQQGAQPLPPIAGEDVPPEIMQVYQMGEPLMKIHNEPKHHH